MKVFSKIFLALSLLIVVASCESTELDLLDNPNAVSPSNAELDLFYNNIQLSFRNLVNDASGISAPAVRMVAMTSRIPTMPIITRRVAMGFGTMFMRIYCRISAQCQKLPLRGTTWFTWALPRLWRPML